MIPLLHPENIAELTNQPKVYADWSDKRPNGIAPCFPPTGQIEGTRNGGCQLILYVLFVVVPEKEHS